MCKLSLQAHGVVVAAQLAVQFLLFHTRLAAAHDLVANLLHHAVELLVASRLQELLSEPLFHRLRATELAEYHIQLANLERKDERRVATMLKLSGLPPGKTLEDFDWTFQPRADRRQIDALATCSYLREKMNVLFLGPFGGREEPSRHGARRQGHQERLLGLAFRAG